MPLPRQYVTTALNPIPTTHPHPALRPLQPAGHKRVANYIKAQDKNTRLRAYMSREEREVADINREAEEQLVHQHCTPERLVAERQGPGGEVQVLVKWSGLPYSEATWENSAALVQKKGEVI